VLFAGGKSFGGRMTSQSQAESPLPGVRGVAFLGFPLHPAGKPSVARAQHLTRVNVPMLFLQGDRDTLADLALLSPVVEQLGARARLVIFSNADHSFHVPARSGHTDAEVHDQMAAALLGWLDELTVASAISAMPTA
jgi:predicted alpha/beta-hydrolase family hydrolase